MDAVKYLKTLRRMCNCECRKCEFGKRRGEVVPCTVWRKTHPEEAVAIVERWDAEHPIKTRQSVFLEQFPEAELTQAGVITIYPFVVSAAYRGKDGNCISCSDSCPECRKAFWLAEVEDGSVH